MILKFILDLFNFFCKFLFLGFNMCGEDLDKSARGKPVEWNAKQSRKEEMEK